MSPAAQGMDWQKVWLIVGLFFVGLLVFVSRKWMVGAETLHEHDRNSALRDERRNRIQRERQAEWWKRVVKKWNAAGRVGEAKRRKSAA